MDFLRYFVTTMSQRPPPKKACHLPEKSLCRHKGLPHTGNSLPRTLPYLLVIHAQAGRWPHSRLTIAGVLTIVFHLRLHQAAAQGAHPLSPVQQIRSYYNPAASPDPLPKTGIEKGELWPGQDHDLALKITPLVR